MPRRRPRHWARTAEHVRQAAGSVLEPRCRGGAGRMEHFLEAFQAGAEAALAASVFHFGEIPIPELKRYLAEKGVHVRLD